MNNNFVKLGIFIIVVFCGILLSKIPANKEINKATKPTNYNGMYDHSDEIESYAGERLKSYEIITEPLNKMTEKLEKMKARQGLGLENSKDVENLASKVKHLEDLLTGVEDVRSIEAGCMAECNSDSSFSDNYSKCKIFLITPYDGLLIEYIKLRKTFEDGTITEDEFKNLETKILEKDKKTIEEAHRIVKANNLDSNEYCQSSKNTVSTSKTELHEKIGVTEECLNAWKIIEAEGYYTEDKLPCPQEDIDKVEKFCLNENINCFED